MKIKYDSSVNDAQQALFENILEQERKEKALKRITTIAPSAGIYVMAAEEAIRNGGEFTLG